MVVISSSIDDYLSSWVIECTRKEFIFNQKLNIYFSLISFEGQQQSQGCGHRVGSTSAFITLSFSLQHKSQNVHLPRRENKIEKP